MPLKNMQLTKSDVKDHIVTDESDVPKYPWGLTIHLNNDSIEKLGFDEMPEVGKSVMVIAFADVTEVSESESANGKKNRRVNLQITDMSIEKKVEKDTLKTLYGE